MSGDLRWISHRGFEEFGVENTKDAFDGAIRCGFTHLETDLRSTQDGDLVLCHDKDFARLGGPSIPISQMRSLELKDLILDRRSKVMFFNKFIMRYAAYDWIFDVKPETAYQSIDFLKHWTETKNNKEWFLSHGRFLFWSKAHQSYFQRFFPNAICLARKEECYRAGIAFLLGQGWAAGIEAGKVYSIPPKFMGLDLFRKDFLSCYHRRGARTLAFLPDTKEQAIAAQEAGFDEILTNHEMASM
jgi:glycerophosphoryl diester phosphodiesterase